MHTVQASQNHPGLIIYLLDVSGSMTLMNGEKRRLDLVTDSLYVALKQMVFRSTKGSRISSRYRVAVYAYSDDVHDVLGGIKGIDELMHTGLLPSLQTQRFTDTAKAFQHVEQLLHSELARIQDGPAPLICHMTDGVYTGEDPEPIVRRIMDMSVKDGNVLVENIFISDDVLQQEVEYPKRWQGVQEHTDFRDEYGRKLRRMSSVIPESYRQMMREANYNLAEGAYLMFPGTNPDLVSLGFQMSAATPIY
ncbi:vWA domain-containing protein [Paenibacillus sinopodophylli]|uniref:vWA domain-containing protein n=1 Tax=Paenibacillus sinopodophylli TaxID=1837342 RepID=UPI001FE6AA7C|nr:vWA domain-containing protein [Paenibacillus sinopodophylli]